MAGKVLLRQNVTFVKNNRNRAGQSMNGENCQNGGYTRNAKNKNKSFRNTSNRNRGIWPNKSENFQNRGNTICSRQVRSNLAKFDAQRLMKRRKLGRREGKKMRALLKRMNPEVAEQKVMSLQNLLKSKRLLQESKSFIRTRAPTREELLIKVTSAFFL